MVNDKEVKTVVSPFAVRENEVKVFDGKEGFASINQVVFKMDMGYINESHIKALEVVNEFGFITSRQCTQILDLRGKINDIEEDKRQTRVAKWLEDLTKSKFSSYERHIIWRYNNLGIREEQLSKEENQIIEKYLLGEKVVKRRERYETGIYIKNIKNIVDYDTENYDSEQNIEYVATKNEKVINQIIMPGDQLQAENTLLKKI